MPSAPAQTVLNWHVTEACNYRCGYCYAHWERPSKTELIRDAAATRALLAELYMHFAGRSGARPPRLNIAGGEPLLHQGRLLPLLKLARAIGFEVSMISNASLLDAPMLTALTGELSMLGLSLDAARPEVLAQIGRVDRHGRTLDLDRLAEAVAQARQAHPHWTLKLNTVVCAPNWQDDLGDLVRRLAPSRWKVLRALPVVSQALEVSDAQFQAFVERHRALSSVMVVEDHADMQGSYIMIDPLGRFFQNRPGAFGYDYSPPILEAGAGAAFAQIGWSALKFARRYTPAAAAAEVCA
ncbi:viperin family antiviral radical SAM protein [Sphaerotilus uruguayifluvii]|uniref:S-adenosylmethionine-dependent nucleotide dehydratase n=1 Tax=Sphaerotilus uruguayifluvii TaxID=2735897 RepID=A0ABX2G7N9_9BURK|nr:viperin family antiviral radical SAM protein [Leptothrix sp. C29]NRT58064.1 radical S-adenosyl methionine domain-containing protein 2 [Leptothrix sp. C29]